MNFTEMRQINEASVASVYEHREFSLRDRGAVSELIEELVFEETVPEIRIFPIVPGDAPCHCHSGRITHGKECEYDD